MSGAFISWSGEQARAKAASLRGLIGDVLPEVGSRVFMSDTDIAAGSLWLTSIDSSLDKSSAGVIVVTPENVRNPWLQYEAGALATRVEKKMVIPLLSGIGPSGLASTPLSNFQALEMSKDSVAKVILSFAAALSVERQEESIRRSFEKWWPDYETSILAAPVSSTKKSATIDDLYSLVASLQSSLRSQSDALSSLTSALVSQAESVWIKPSNLRDFRLKGGVGLKTTFAGNALKGNLPGQEPDETTTAVLNRLIEEGLRARAVTDAANGTSPQSLLDKYIAASSGRKADDEREDTD